MPRHVNCPYCQSKETFISTHKDKRFCNNCDRTYDRSDEICLAKKRQDENFAWSGWTGF